MQSFLDVRRASWSYWLQNGGPMERTVAALVWREPSRELRAWCLQRWANDRSYADMLRDVEAWPESAGEVLEALSLAGRLFRLTELSALLDDRHLDTALRIARRPFDVADRRILVARSGLLALARDGADGRSWREHLGSGWLGAALRRCLHEAYSSHDAPALTEEEKTWVPILEAQIATLEAAPLEAAPEEDHEDEDMDSPDRSDDMRRLLLLLTNSAAALDASGGLT